MQQNFGGSRRVLSGVTSAFLTQLGGWAKPWNTVDSSVWLRQRHSVLFRGAAFGLMVRLDSWRWCVRRDSPSPLIPPIEGEGNTSLEHAVIR